LADVSPSMTLEAGFYVTHIFRMTAFFLIAGFFAHLAFHRKGLKAFIRDRAKRIAAPFGVFWLPMVGLTIGMIVLAAWVGAGGQMPVPGAGGPEAGGLPAGRSPLDL